MNYILLVNYFWQCDEEHSFTESDTRLYFYLLHTCNRLKWKNPFGHSDRHMALRLGMSVNTIRTAKNRLKQRGMIDFKAPANGSKGLDGQTKYELIQPTVSKIDTDTDTVPDTVVDTVPDTVPGNNNKQNLNLNETKLKEELSTANAAISSLSDSIQDLKEKLDKALKEKPIKPPQVPLAPPDKERFLDCVFLKKEEYQTLLNTHGNEKTDLIISALNNYKLAHGKKYASDYGAINSWVLEKIEKEKNSAKKEKDVNSAKQNPALSYGAQPKNGTAFGKL